MENDVCGGRGEGGLHPGEVMGHALDSVTLLNPLCTGYRQVLTLPITLTLLFSL